MNKKEKGPVAAGPHSNRHYNIIQLFVAFHQPSPQTEMITQVKEVDTE